MRYQTKLPNSKTGERVRYRWIIVLDRYVYLDKSCNEENSSSSRAFKIAPLIPKNELGQS
jgi:hypothetical protein